MNAFKNELKTFFKTPVAYIYGAIILVVAGIETIHFNLNGSLSNFEYAIDGSAFILMILAPIVTFYLHYHLHRPSETPLSARVKATGLTLILVAAAPCLLLLLYPLVQLRYGDIYLPTVLSEIVSFFVLILVSLSTCLLCAVSEKNRFFAATVSLLSHLLAYFMTPIATRVDSPYASMLLFTVIIVLIGVALYRISRHSTLTLGVLVVLEVVHVLFFVTKQSEFTFLTSTVFALLSPFERFRVAVGGILDIPGLLYMTSIAIVSFLFAAAAAKAQEPKEEPEEPQKPRKKSAKVDEPVDEVPDVKPAFDPKVPAAALMAAVVVNVCIWLFTGGALIVDTTPSRLYTPSSQLKNEIRTLDEDVTTYWIVQNGAEDASIRTALYVYDSMGLKFKVRRLNPDVSSDFIKENTIEAIYNNGLLLKSESRARYVDFNDLFGYDYSRYDEIGTYDLVFQLEDHLSHALEFVSGSQLMKLYLSTGHTERELPEYFRTLFEKQDIEIVPLDLTQPVPEDAAGVFVLAPEQDLTESEADQLSLYLQKGGKLLLVTSLHEEGTESLQLESVMLEYGALLLPGVVIDMSANYYTGTYPYHLRPDVMDHPVNSLLVETRTAPTLQIAQGIIHMPVNGVTQTPLLMTSSEAFSKLSGLSSTTYEYEEGDVQGTMIVSAAYETAAGTKIVWIPSGSIVNTDTNTESSGGNQYLLQGALSWLIPSTIHQTIPDKMYNYGVLRITGDAISRVGVVVVFVIPFLYLSIGLLFLVIRKRREFLKQEAEAEEARRLEEEEKRRQEEEEEAKRQAFKKAREEASEAARESARQAAKESARKAAQKALEERERQAKKNQ